MIDQISLFFYSGQWHIKEETIRSVGSSLDRPYIEHGMAYYTLGCIADHTYVTGIVDSLV